MIDEDYEEEVEQGAPPWMATFADLMSLLVCFFVLLLSFSEMDVIKYKQIAGSMKEAFGVQARIEAPSIPKGTSVAMKEFSPGSPQPIPSESIQQHTTESLQPHLRVGDDAAAGQNESPTQASVQVLAPQNFKDMLSYEEGVSKLEQILSDSVSDGKIDVESKRNEITIRIRENGSFSSGSASLNEQFLPVLAELRQGLVQINGMISVEGHTDDVPISGSTFDSNWELSAARALSVAKALMQGGELDEGRFMVVGHADTRPFRANDSDQNRAYNRRVEIVIRHGEESGTDANLNRLKQVVEEHTL